MSMSIPVYLFTGFLDAGKTAFIQETLEDPGFNTGEKTLVLLCEEGENEYRPERFAGGNVSFLPVEEQAGLTTAFLKDYQKKHRVDRVLIEYNGMWPLQALYDALPTDWDIYQIILLADSTTFASYMTNMRQLAVDKLQDPEMVIFNRCTDELKAALRKRNLRMVNRRADIYLEDLNGNSEDYNNGEVCPFDLDQKVIDIPDNDYGVWYVDVMDYPDRWAGKTVHMKLLMCHSKKYPGTHCPGRFAMVCCENDVQFLGLVAKGVDLNKYKNRDWVEVEARMALENHSAYKGKGPVMHIISIKPCEKPANEVVTF